jgi:hypothetical protein
MLCNGFQSPIVHHLLHTVHLKWVNVSTLYSIIIAHSVTIILLPAFIQNPTRNTITPAGIRYQWTLRSVLEKPCFATLALLVFLRAAIDIGA